MYAYKKISVLLFNFILRVCALADGQACGACARAALRAQLRGCAAQALQPARSRSDNRQRVVHCELENWLTVNRNNGTLWVRRLFTGSLWVGEMCTSSL